MGWHLDRRVAAVFGTHTHVPAADGRVLPGGTAFISDVGMTGLEGQRARGQTRAGAGRVDHADADPVRDRDEDVWVMGAVVEVNPAGAGGFDSRR